MRVSCEAPMSSCSKSLIEDIRALGKEPIVTGCVVRAVYEGPDIALGEAIVERFKEEPHHGIVADYDEQEQKKIERKKRRKER